MEEGCDGEGLVEVGMERSMGSKDGVYQGWSGVGMEKV